MHLPVVVVIVVVVVAVVVLVVVVVVTVTNTTHGVIRGTGRDDATFLPLSFRI